MESSTIILITFGGYLLLLLGIGWWGDRRFGHSYEGFVTADKSLGGWVAAISSAASSESAWVMLGLSGLGYSKGPAGYWAALGCTLGFLATSLFVVVQLRRSSGGMKVLTLGDYLEQALGDQRHVIRVVSALIIAVFMLVYVVAQFVGTGKQMAGMNLMSYQWGVVAGALIIGIYVLIGGYAAVCWTDMIQGILMAAVMIIFPVLALDKAGGMAPVLQELETSGQTFWIGQEGFSWAWAGFALGQLGIGIGYPGMPHSIIRFITVRDEKAARNAAIIGLVWGALVLFGAVSLGVVGRTLMPGLKDAEHILPAFTAAHFHPVISGFILAAVTAAIMSTADSQLMMAATAIIHDFWRTVRKRTAEAGNKSTVIKTRVVIGVLSLIAMCVALPKPQVIYTFVLFAWGALGASFTPVVLLSLHWKRFNWQGALAAFIAGPATILIWKAVPGLSEALYELFPGAIVATLAGVIVALATGGKGSEQQRGDAPANAA
jgi:sodium/proline symporter